MSKDHPASLSPADCIEQFASDSTFGLAEREALLRTKEFGINAFPRNSTVGIIFSSLSPYSPLLLTLAGVTFYFTGSYFLTCFILLILCIHQGSYFLFFRTKIQHSLEKEQFLEETIPEYTPTVRSGKIVTIPTEHLVPGDIVYLAEGELIGADIRILSSNQIIVDESILFGPEYSTVKKSSKEMEKRWERPYTENILLAGSYVLSGSAKGIVWRTGKDRFMEKLFVEGRQDQKEKRHHALQAIVYWNLLMLLTLGTLVHLFEASLWSLFGVVLATLIPTTLYLALLPLQKHFAKELPHGHLIDIETLLVPEFTGAKVYLQGEEMSLTNHTQVKKNHELLKNFFELFFLALPKELKQQEFQELEDLEKFLKKTCKITISPMEDLEKNEALSFFYAHPHSQTFFGKSVYQNPTDEETTVFEREPIITTLFADPLSILEKSIYVSDEHMQLMKRRYFKGEKEKLKKNIQQLLKQGFMLYGVGLEETLLKTKDKVEIAVTFVGFVIIPKILRLKKEKHMPDPLWLYSFKKYDPDFLAKTFHLPESHILEGVDLMNKSDHYKNQLKEKSFRLFHGIVLEDLLLLSKLLRSKKHLPLQSPLWDEEVMHILFPKTHHANLQQIQSYTKSLLQEKRIGNRIERWYFWYCWIMALSIPLLFPWILMNMPLLLLLILFAPLPIASFYYIPASGKV